MKDFRTRKQEPKEHFVYSWFFLLFLLILLFILGRSAYASLTKRQHATLEREKYQEEYQALEEKKEEVVERIERLKTPRGQEEELRKRFDITKEGETMIRIVE